MGLKISDLHVRRSAYISASPERVWQEFQTFERISAWLNSGHQLHAFEPKLGGVTDFSVEIEGMRQRYGGTVLVWEPAHEVSFSSNWSDPGMAWPVPTFWTIRLAGLYDGCQVEIFHHGFDRLGADAGANLEGYEEGWTNRHLKALRAIVED